MTLPALMASLSKCHLCRQYHYTAGKQLINILMGEISFHSNPLSVVEICAFQCRQSESKATVQKGSREQMCHWGYKRAFHQLNYTHKTWEKACQTPFFKV